MIWTILNNLCIHLAPKKWLCNKQSHFLFCILNLFLQKIIIIISIALMVSFMKFESILIVIEWIITIALLIKFIPRNKLREAYVAYFFKQLITWLTGLVVAELGLIIYPVRMFPRASGTSFTFEYFVYPAICAIFNVNYPENKSKLVQSFYYISFCTVITIVEVIIEKTTDILIYIHWTWYITWITLFITFFMTRKYFEWFFRLNKEK